MLTLALLFVRDSGTRSCGLHRIKMAPCLLHIIILEPFALLCSVSLQGGTGFASCGVELHARESRPVMQV